MPDQEWPQSLHLNAVEQPDESAFNRDLMQGALRAAAYALRSFPNSARGAAFTSSYSAREN